MKPDELKKMKPMTGKERLGANRDSEYLGAEDIDPGSEPILTIEHIYNGTVTLQRGKENKDVISFVEDRVPGIKNVRPLIVNATNRKTLRKIYKVVQLYIDHNVRDPQTGEKTDGIRIRPKVPAAPRTEPIVCEECGKPITGIGTYSAEDVAAINKKRYGRQICADCSKKMSEAAQSATEQEKPAQEPDSDLTESIEALAEQVAGGASE